MTLVIIVLVGAGIAWAVLQRPHTATAREAAATKLRALGAGSSSLLANVRGRFDRSADHAAFKAWITALVQALPEAGAGASAFSSWIDGLSVKELRTFRSTLAAFCDTLDIEPDWLRNDGMSERPALRRSLEESVGMYALAYARGAEQQGDIARTRAFQRWLAAPNRPDNRAFGTALFAGLVQRGMIAPPADMLIAPERTRRAYANQAIRDASARDPQAFDAVLDTVLNRSAPAQEAPAAPEEPATPPEDAAATAPGATSRRSRAPQADNVTV